VHTRIAIRVEGYEAHIDAAINHNAHAPQYALRPDDDDPLYTFTSHLRIIGKSIYPENRTGDRYELRIYGDDAPSRRLNVTLGDVHTRDEHGTLQFRTYRGRAIPVYSPPEGMGLLEKIRGENSWTGWLHVLPRFVTDTLVLLAHEKDLFLVILERKVERTRWIQA
jgi:hypothetical protein